MQHFEAEDSCHVLDILHLRDGHDMREESCNVEWNDG